MRNTRNAMTAFALVALAAASPAMAQAVSQEVPGHGQINWTDKTITVTGSGAPDLKAANVAVARLGAERAAKLDAFRNILEAVKGVRVSGTQTAEQAMASSPQVKSKVEGVIRAFKVLDTKYYSDGGVDLVVQVPLDGVTDALVADAGTAAKPGGAASNSGVIINAKGIEVTPGLAPRILDEKGAEVFAAKHVSKEALQSGGVCGYNTSLDAAKRDARVGDKPLVVRALRPAEKGSADLVISDADAAKLAALGPALAKGSVVIVTD